MNKSRFFIDEPEKEIKWTELKQEIKVWLLATTPIYTTRQIIQFIRTNPYIYKNTNN